MGSEKHEVWGSKKEFLLSCLGYAVGIGNVWRFPYLCYRNGGGAFLVPYTITLLICGIPLFYLETNLGQFAVAGAISVFNISPILKGAGYATMVLNAIATSYFSLIMSYPMLYMYHSFTVPLPWESCDNPWNTDNCVSITGNSTIDIENLNTTGISPSTPAEEFFHLCLLNISSGIEELGDIVWPLFWCNTMCWIICYACIARGVKSVGKVVYFTVPFPYLVLAVLFVRGVTLPGAIDGIMFYLMPDWDQLKNPKVWADAAVQIFYSLGPGWGGIVGMASHNPFFFDNLGASLIVPIVNCGTSVFAGFVVFSVLGFASRRAHVPVSRVATAGPALAFVTYPAAIAMMPWPNFWAVLFFVMLFFLGIDTMFVTIEALVAAMLTEWKVLRKRSNLVLVSTCFMLYLLSLACTTQGRMYIVQLLDWYVALLAPALVCVCELAAAVWLYGARRLARDFRFMRRGQDIASFWILTWRYICPVILMIILTTAVWFNSPVSYSGRSYPAWADALGWSVTWTSALCIPLYATVAILRSKGSFLQRLKRCSRTSPAWSPSDPQQRRQWLALTYNQPALDHDLPALDHDLPVLDRSLPALNTINVNLLKNPINLSSQQ